jgi:hypothetical protein
MIFYWKIGSGRPATSALIIGIAMQLGCQAAVADRDGERVHRAEPSRAIQAAEGAGMTPIYDDPNHPFYGPVRRLHIMKMFPAFAKRFIDDTWTDTRAT